MQAGGENIIFCGVDVGSGSYWPVLGDLCLLCVYFVPGPAFPLQCLSALRYGRGDRGQSGDMRVPCSGSPAGKCGLWLTPGGGVTLRPALDALTTPEGGVKADAGKKC